jgi:hypothetical protein
MTLLRHDFFLFLSELRQPFFSENSIEATDGKSLNTQSLRDGELMQAFPLCPLQTNGKRDNLFFPALSFPARCGNVSGGDNLRCNRALP